jgi:N-acetylmuramic acid 6-phosphate etherase
MTLPPDRSHIATEQLHQSGVALDQLSTDAFIGAMVEESIDAARSVDRCRDAIGLFIDALVPRMIDGGRLLYLGAGTSGRLGVLDASECPPTFQSDPTQVVGIIAGGDESLRRSSEHREDQREGAQEELEKLGIGSMDTLLGIAAGGTTPWVLGALEYGKSQGCCTALLRCADAGLVEVDHLLELQTGPELLAGSTRLKAGTATKIVLNTITTLVFTRLGKVHGQRMVDLRATNDKLHDRALRILADYVPSLDRAEADRVLSESDGELKTAIVVASKDVTAEAARHALKHAGGRLGDVLGCR